MLVNQQFSSLILVLKLCECKSPHTMNNQLPRHSHTEQLELDGKHCGVCVVEKNWSACQIPVHRWITFLHMQTWEQQCKNQNQFTEH